MPLFALATAASLFAAAPERAAIANPQTQPAMAATNGATASAGGGMAGTCGGR